MESTKNGNRSLIIIIAIIATVIIAAAVVVIILLTGDKKGYRSISVNEIVGDVTIENNGDVYKAYPDMHLTDGFAMITASKSYSRMSLDDEKFIKLEEESRAKFESLGSGGKSTYINLEYGSISNEITRPLREGEEFKVTTPNAVLSVRGTLFITKTRKDTDGKWISEVYTFGGSVATHRVLPDGTNVNETVYVNAGYKTVIKMDDEITYYVEEVDIDVGDNVDPIEITEVDTDILVAVYDASVNGHDVCYEEKEILEELKNRNVDLSDYSSYHTGKPLSEKTAETSSTTTVQETASDNNSSSSTSPSMSAPIIPFQSSNNTTENTDESSSESSGDLTDDTTSPPTDDSSSDITDAPPQENDSSDDTTAPPQTSESETSVTEETEVPEEESSLSEEEETTAPEEEETSYSQTTAVPEESGSSDITTTVPSQYIVSSCYTYSGTPETSESTPGTTPDTPPETTPEETTPETTPEEITSETTPEEETPPEDCEHKTHKLVRISHVFTSGDVGHFSLVYACTECGGDMMYISETASDPTYNADDNTYTYSVHAAEVYEDEMTYTDKTITVSAEGISFNCSHPENYVTVETLEEANCRNGKKVQKYCSLCDNYLDSPTYTGNTDPNNHVGYHEDSVTAVRDGMGRVSGLTVHIKCDGCGDTHDEEVSVGNPSKTVWADSDHTMVTNTYNYSFTYNGSAFSGSVEVIESAALYEDADITETCPVCSSEFKNSEYRIVVTQEATCSSTGSVEYRCPHCGEMITGGTIDATGEHNYNYTSSHSSSVLYVWSSDNTSCTAYFECLNDGCTSEDTADCTIVTESETEVHATCTFNGVVFTSPTKHLHKYTASVTATLKTGIERTYTLSDYKFTRTLTCSSSCTNPNGPIITATVDSSVIDDLGDPFPLDGTLAIINEMETYVYDYNEATFRFVYNSVTYTGKVTGTITLLE